jgi:hypothetical protein
VFSNHDTEDVVPRQRIRANGAVEIWEQDPQGDFVVTEIGFGAQEEAEDNPYFWGV